MQNVPISEQHKNAATKWQSEAVKNVNADMSGNLFDELLLKQAEVVGEDCATASVSADDRMAETASRAVDDRAEESREHEVGESAVEAAEKERAENRQDEVPPEKAADERMTEEDVRNLEEDLKEYGLSEEEIRDLEEQAASEEGLTWGQFVGFLSQKMQGMKGVSLSDEQVKGLTSFLNKLGFDAKGAEKVLNMLRNGDTEKALDTIQQKLAAMGDDANIKLDKNEIEAFVSAMSLSKEASAKLRELMSKAQDPKGLREAFAGLRDELDRMDSKDARLVRAVSDALKEATAEGKNQGHAAKHLGADVDMRQRLAMNERGNNGGMNANTGQKDSRDAAMESFMQPSGEGESEADDFSSWRSFFSKLREDPAAGGQARLRNAVKTSNEFAATQNSASAKSDTAQTMTERTAAPRMAKQVENAFIKNLGQGNKQLTVQLNPENLGKLHVVLQSRGDEVRAVIRADNPETARMLTDQLESIRNSLQEQGVKVSRLEVQTGLGGSQDGMNWFGEQGHNMAKNQEEAARLRDRMRMMRGDADALARDVNNPEQRANLTQQGLHVVA